MFACDRCGEEFDKASYKNHILSCNESFVNCRFCNIPTQLSDIISHENICGNRTEVCELCREFVKYKERSLHNNVQCQRKVIKKEEKSNRYVEYKYGLDDNEEDVYDYDLMMAMEASKKSTGVAKKTVATKTVVTKDIKRKDSKLANVAKDIVAAKVENKPRLLKRKSESIKEEKVVGTKVETKETDLRKVIKKEVETKGVAKNVVKPMGVRLDRKPTLTRKSEAKK